MDGTMHQAATGGHSAVPGNWMSASQVRPFAFADPALVWLEHHGAEHGLYPSESPYDFLPFIGEKAAQFERKWASMLAPGAVRVCDHPGEVRRVEKLAQTLELMGAGTPLISQPALWWAPERVYGVPDLIAHSSWARQHLSAAFAPAPPVAPALGPAAADYYVVLDLKFTTKLDDSSKKQDLQNYSWQLRIYSYMLGHLQQYMPKYAYLAARDRLDEPLAVPIGSTLGQPLDEDLAELRDRYLHIKSQGAQYVPWQDEIVTYNLGHDDERWAQAKRVMAKERRPGGDPCLIYRITPRSSDVLHQCGYADLHSLLRADPDSVPLENCPGIGPSIAADIRPILRANGSGVCVRPSAHLVPPRKPLEAFVDYEYFTNVNVDFDAQWPGLEGHEMLFMVGVGWEDHGQWAFRSFESESETTAGENALLEQFVHFISDSLGYSPALAHKTALYHWTPAEAWQSRRAADRHSLDDTHPLRSLPWVDLEKVFRKSGSAIPGQWDYSLKTVAKALGAVDRSFDPQWPGDLDTGLRAMVMGWHAYRDPNPANTSEMAALRQYLEADCRAMRLITKWLRGPSRH
jgi:hypothetical protein